MDRRKNRWTAGQKDQTQAEREREAETDRQTDKQAYRQAGRQEGRQTETDRQTDKDGETHSEIYYTRIEILSKCLFLQAVLVTPHANT